MKTLNIQTTQKDEVIDITDEIEKEITASNSENGIVNIFVQHTTCALTCADLDPGTDLDFLDAIRKILPNIEYRHPHDPAHTPDHILSSIIGPSVTVPFSNKKLLLGTWQRIILVELNGSKDREIVVSVI